MEDFEVNRKSKSSVAMPAETKVDWTENSDPTAASMSMAQEFQLSNYNPSTYTQQAYNLYNPQYYHLRNGLYLSNPSLYGTSYPTSFDYNYAGYGMPYLNNSTSRTSPISTIQQSYRRNLMNSNTFPVSMNISPNSTSQPFDPTVTSTTSKSEKNKSRKRKKPMAPAEIQQNYKRVFIWELDELCYTHLLQPAIQNQLTHLIEQLLKGYFDLTSYEAQEYDHINIEDGPLEEIFNETSSLYNSSDSFASSNEDKSSELSSTQVQSSTNSNTAAVDNLKKIAQKQQNMKRIYNQYRNNISGLLGDDAKPMLGYFDSLEAMDARRYYKKCLRLAIDRCSTSTLYTNIVMGRETLPCSLARLLLNRAAELVPVENIYSTARNDRAVVLEKIVQRFKKEPVVIITANPETVQSAKSLNLAVWQIRDASDVEKFYVAMDRVLC